MTSNPSNQQSLNQHSSTDEAELLSVAIKSAAIAAGVVGVVELYRHRRLLAVTGAFVGALMWTNRCMKEQSGLSSRRRYKKIQGAPSFRGDHISTATQQPADELEEAQMESFPASDAPASHRRA